MSCGEMECPQLNCEEDELVSYREEECCPYCLSDWVEVSSPQLHASSSSSLMNSVINHTSMTSMYWWPLCVSENLCLHFHFQAMNPSINIQRGQSVTLTCAVHVRGVGMKNIVWYKDENRIYDGYKISLNRLIILENHIDLTPVSLQNITW